MELNAKIMKGGKQIRIQKKGTAFATLVTIKDAKLAYEQGRVGRRNRCFQRLADNDFDVEKTLGWYIKERERLAKEKCEKLGHDWHTPGGDQPTRCWQCGITK